jgi:hypothetical protein
MTTEKDAAITRLQKLFRSNPDRFLTAMRIAKVTGFFSHSQRISDLRVLGWDITCHTVTVKGKKYSSYRWNRKKAA